MMDGPPALSIAEVEKWLDGVRADSSTTDAEHFTSKTLLQEHAQGRTIGDVSEGTNLTETFTDCELAIISKALPDTKMSTAKDTVLGGPVWQEEHHEDDWSATVGTNEDVIAGCFPGAAALLKRMNPEQYQMPLGTRLVCIKTQHLDNLHIALQRGTWVTSDRVGEKINRVYEEHDGEGVEKVLFVFSINRQRSFCALAEMTGRWAKSSDDLAGWQESAGSFNIVGTIPVTFTHVKNVANEYFSHLHHENPNQPITNMWNGMYFETQKGRDVVKIFHETAHFTNVLCRDKRKSYNPFDPVAHARQLDPRLCHKFGLPPHSKSGRFRDVPFYAVSNWRQGQARYRDETTPTRSTLPKDTTSGSADTLIPPRPRSMKRDHVPAPLSLHNTTNSWLPSLFPRPGQLVQCIVGEDGSYIPITPSADMLNGPPSNPQLSSVQSARHTGSLPRVQQPQVVQSPSQQLSMQSVPMHGYGRRGYQDGSQAKHQTYPNNPQPKSSVPHLPADGGKFASPHHPLRHVKTAHDLAGASKSGKTERTTDTSILFREAAKKAQHSVPTRSELKALAMASTDSSALLAARACTTMMDPRIISQHAQTRNQTLLSYETWRHLPRFQAYDSAVGSSSSAMPSEYKKCYKDWASTSEVERQRIKPVSPLTESDPFVVESVSKYDSPTAKAFGASVNRELRTLRRGERAMPTPTKATTNPFAFPMKDPYGTQTLAGEIAGLGSAPRAAAGECTDGGVPIPLNPPRGNEPIEITRAAPGRRQDTTIVDDQTGDMSPLSGFGQIPRSIMPALVSAGQYAPNIATSGRVVEVGETQTPKSALPQQSHRSE